MQRRILIIDDHDDLASAAEEIFVELGHTVDVVNNREDARSRFSNVPPQVR